MNAKEATSYRAEEIEDSQFVSVLARNGGSPSSFFVGYVTGEISYYGNPLPLGWMITGLRELDS